VFCAKSYVVPAANKQLQRTVTRHRARQVRHFIVHMPRAANGSARPLNCTSCAWSDAVVQSCEFLKLR
jgi:hypothetical protein